MSEIRPVPLTLIVHVPKAAGQSIREQALKTYGPTATYGYSPGSNRLSSMAAQGVRPGSKDIQPDRVEHVLEGVQQWAPGLFNTLGVHVRKQLEAREARISESAEEVFRKDGPMVIIGHFAVNAFDQDLQATHMREHARFLTVIRHPLQRMASHYQYLRELRALFELQGPYHWSYGQDSSLSFRDFALQENLQNYQTQFTGTEIGAYALVGIADTSQQLHEFLTTAELMEADEEVPHRNKTQLQDPSVTTALNDTGFVRTFEDFHSKDYALYRTALERNPR